MVVVINGNTYDNVPKRFCKELIFTEFFRHCQVGISYAKVIQAIKLDLPVKKLAIIAGAKVYNEKEYYEKIKKRGD